MEKIVFKNKKHRLKKKKTSVVYVIEKKDRISSGIAGNLHSQ